MSQISRIDITKLRVCFYQKATDFARTELTPTHTVRLALALNFSVFYYIILNTPDCARLLAKNAIKELKAVGVDATWIMQQLREVAKRCTDPSSEAQVEHQKDAEDAEDAEDGIYSATFKNVSPSFPLVVYSTLDKHHGYVSRSAGCISRAAHAFADILE